LTALILHLYRNGRLDLSTTYFTTKENYLERIRRLIPQQGDLVITREAPMGEICIIPDGLECCLGQRMVLLRPDSSKYHNKFMLYAIQSPEIQHEILINEGTGSTVSNLRIPLLENLTLPNPPIPTQKAIAKILGTLDDKIELLRSMNETLDAMARALFKSWFIDFAPVRKKAEGLPTGLPKEIEDLFPDSFIDSELGEIPAGWEVKSIDEEFTFLNGIAGQKYAPNNDETDIPVIKIAQVRAGDSNGADLACSKIPPEYLVKNGDILFPNG
jgi:type I restriction enzyme S subunit